MHLEDSYKISDDAPVLVVELKLAQLQCLVASNFVDRLSIFKGNAQHVIGRVPSGDDIARDKLRFEIKVFTNSTPGW